jgi:hypothetical protein
MLYPASAKNNIATALGFVERDVSVGTPLMIHSMSAPTCFDGDTATVQVGFQSPHGLRVGDEVEFLHTRTSFELGVVSSTPSDHYVAVAVPIDSLLETEGMKIKLRKKSITVAENATCPRDGILRSYLHDQNVGVKLPCSAVILEGQQDIAHEWKHGSATVYRDTSQRLCLEMPYPRHLMFRAGHSMIRKRGQVVADRPLDLSLPFMFFRLWLGRVECMGIKRPSMPSVFARVQLRDGKRCFVNSSDAVVGRVEITPQMDKVSWLEVEAIDARGMPLAATWSMLLRFEGSSIPISHERIS